MNGIWDEIRADRESGARRLVAEYGNRLYAAALLLCGNTADAEELVFRAFERAVSRIERYEPSGDFFSWLYVIMLNFRRMDLRRNRPDVISVGTPQELPEVCDEALADTLSGLDAELIRAAVGRLPPMFSEVLVLRYLEGRSMEDISTIVGVPVGTVKSRLHNAKAAFREVLASNGMKDLGGES